MQPSNNQPVPGVYSPQQAVQLEREHYTPDRSLLVPPGYLVKSGYVQVDRVRLLCKSRMAVGDVDRAYQRALQAAPSQVHPAPNGVWDGDVFCLKDGRHSYVAMLMLGMQYILVEWLEKQGEAA